MDRILTGRFIDVVTRNRLSGEGIAGRRLFRRMFRGSFTSDGNYLTRRVMSKRDVIPRDLCMGNSIGDGARSDKIWFRR